MKFLRRVCIDYMDDKPDFETELAVHLEWIDGHLVEIELPIRDRPFRAATIFADECIVGISNDGEKTS